MTEVVTESTGPVDGPAAAPVPAEPQGSTVDSVRQRASDAAERALGAARDGATTVADRIRNNATVAADRGHITIGNEVVEKIAGIAAREVPGVHDLGGDVARALTTVKERLHLGSESARQGVTVKLDGRRAEISVVIVIEYGFQVFSVAETVREKVISAVENLLGLDVQGVDVTVDDVHVPENGVASADAERAKGYVADTRAIVVGA